MGVRYIGSKARIADSIVALAGSPSGGGRFVDAFCGTGSVARAAAEAGWPILINDSLPSAVVMAISSMVSAREVPFANLGGYSAAVSALQSSADRQGFVHREYSPASVSSGAIERKYFTEKNAAKIDGIRYQIAEWAQQDLLTENEEKLLLGDLMVAANSVANIAGTYGCFLSDWTEPALRPLTLRARELAAPHKGLASRIGDVFTLAVEPDDVVYYDPPYTKRQYAAYYHLLETIVAGDEPEVSGVTGLRPWKDRASDFCYKARALKSLTRLICQTRARRVLLSYSNEGHVPQAALMESLKDVGTVQLHTLESIGRYRPNAVASEAGATVEEYLIEVTPFGVTIEDDLAMAVGE